MSEPWPSAFVAEEVGREKLNRRYFYRRRDGLQTSGGSFRIACAWR